MTEQVGGVDVSRETMAELRVFEGLVRKWTPKINLIAPGTVNALWERHIVDSAQVYRFAPRSYEKWVDLGSGAGFPGIVMAILGKAECRQVEFVLIESDQRKATFLRTAVRALALPATVVAARIEEAPLQDADVVSARALTALSGLLALSQRHLKPGGLALLPKGRQAHQEIAEARQTWSFALEDHASITDPEARILAIQRMTALGS